MIRNFQNRDIKEIVKLWNTAGAGLGYAPQNRDGLERLIFSHPNFTAFHSFVLEEDGVVHGFINGVTGDDLAWGNVRGYVSCLLLDPEYDNEENTALLLTVLEDSFRAKGKTVSAVTFFNPIRLPWIIPGTDGHQHNNMPGIPVDTALYERMLRFGYKCAAEEMAMYLDLSDFIYPQAMKEKEARMAAEGYTVDWYQEGVHQGVDEMVASLGNSMWSAEIPQTAHSGMRLLVGLEGNTVAGFTGPVYPEPTGRGYFAGIAVADAYQGHGLGKLLFYKLCQAERDCGAKYMSLFTGIENHAQNIYKEAGFVDKRHFGVMIKEISG